MNEVINLPDFSDLHILVIGDVMIDRYIFGDVKRISPEAPVPVVEQRTFENRAGGAANVAVNLLALGAKVTLLSITGDDEAADVLQSVLDIDKRLQFTTLKIKGRKTTVKTRIMAGYQHLMRVDNEDKYDISKEEESEILNKFVSILTSGEIGGVILQDYNKGLLTENVISNIMAVCVEKKIPTFVDPKEKNFFAYKNCTLFKPNHREVSQSIGIKTDLDQIDKILRDRMQHTITLITLGSKGLYINDGHGGATYPTSPRIISDVCGAGDSVISVVSLCYIKGMNIQTLAAVANTAGGQVCESPGVVPIDLDNLKSELLKSY